MFSITDVANLTLQKIGAEDVSVEPGQDSHATRTLFAVWDMIRAACIRGHGKHQPKWNFALRSTAIAARPITAANPLPYGWSAAFPRPDACVRLIGPDQDAHGKQRWKVVGDEILTDFNGPLYLWYLVDVPETAKWDALFVETFAARLGFQVADRLTGDLSRKEQCWREFEANLASAAGVDAREDPPVEHEESDWVLARFHGGTSDWSRGLAG